MRKHIFFIIFTLGVVYYSSMAIFSELNSEECAIWVICLILSLHFDKETP